VAGRGRTLKNEPAEVRGSGTGWREENSALCSQLFVRAGHRSLYSIHCDGRCSSHMPLLTPWGTPSSLSGGRILKCFPHSSARSAAQLSTDEAGQQSHIKRPLPVSEVGPVFKTKPGFRRYSNGLPLARTSVVGQFQCPQVVKYD